MVCIEWSTFIFFTVSQVDCYLQSEISWHLFPQDYLDIVGLSAMFPRVEVFLIQGSPVDMLERPQMDGERYT